MKILQTTTVESAWAQRTYRGIHGSPCVDEIAGISEPGGACETEINENVSPTNKLGRKHDSPTMNSNGKDSPTLKLGGINDSPTIELGGINDSPTNKLGGKHESPTMNSNPNF